MFLIDAAGPPAGEVAFEGFGFSCSGKRVAGGVLDEAEDFVGESGFCGHPVLEILERLRLKLQAHA